MTATPSLLQQIHELMMESQHWPIAQLAEYQRRQLGQLLRHAYANVPFYRDRLAPLFHANGSIDWQRWFELPVVTREDLRDKREQMLAKVIPPGHGPVAEHRTSGSTGVPVRTMGTTALTVANRAAQLRSFLNLGIDLAATAATFGRTAANGKPMTESSRSHQWNHPWLMGDRKATSCTINQLLPPQEQLDLLARFGVSIMYETTNRAVLLAEANMASAKRLKLDMVQCYGQRVTEEQRNILAESFGAMVTSIYSSTEAGLIGCQCGRNDDFHVNAEIVLVEILDENNRPCAPGARGRVIVTPFLSTALPLIRYEQSDTAIEMPPCGCGSTLPVIGSILGKDHDMLALPNGTFQLGNLFMSRLSVQDFALAVQIAQVAPDAIEFRYVPKHGVSRSWQQQVKKIFQDEYYSKLKITFKAMQQLPLNARGKQQMVVRELPAASPQPDQPLPG